MATKKRTPAKRKKAVKKVETVKVADTFNATAVRMQNELDEKEKVFAEDTRRFIPITIKSNATSIDLSAPWYLIEKRLFASRKDTSPEKMEEYKKLNEEFVKMHLDIVALKKRFEKERYGHTYRTQPVMKEQGAWVLEEAGKFRSPKDIHRDLTIKQGYTIALVTVRSFIAENKNVVDKHREDFRAELMGNSIATDAGRVAFCMDAYHYYNERWREDHKQVDLNVCLKLLEVIRTEIKGDITIRIDGKIDINHSLEANKSLGQKFGELNVNLIVVGLAAQKAGINPIYLQTQLAQGYYNRWNGVETKPLGLEDKGALIPVSGLIKSYNWDEIREKNSEPLDMGKIEDAIIVQDETVVSTAVEKKALLLNLLNENSSTAL